MKPLQFFQRAALCLIATTVLVRLAAAQTPDTPTNQVIQSFSSESVLMLNNIRATITPAIPPNILAAIQGGALEARQAVRFDPASMTVTVTTFLAQPNAPLPTPSSVDLSNALLSVYVIAVDRVYTSMSPSPSAMFVGTVQSNALNDPFGNLTGAPAAVSIGYTPAAGSTPMTLSNAVVLIAGRSVTYAAAAGGSLAFPPEGGTGGGTPPPSTGPVVNLARANIETNFRQFTLDASQSTNPSGGNLVYSWRVLEGAANILSPNAAVTEVQLIGSRGEHLVEVTVTNSAGQSSTRQVRILYY